jgi:hypothetical protein
MAEILVSDLCECRPPLLIGGLFHCLPGITRMPNRRIPLSGDSRAAPAPCLRASNRTSALVRIFRLFPIALRIVFSIACHCSCSGGFSSARARLCIVMASHFPLQIDCILLGGPFPAQRRRAWQTHWAAGNRKNKKSGIPVDSL